MTGSPSRPLRISVVGGGPAGSLFALYALHHAARAGRDVRVDVFEPRDFSCPGPGGCNMCAGIIPASVLEELAQLSLDLPRPVVLQAIDAYVLHTEAGELRVTMTDPRLHVVAVFRGNGPARRPSAAPISFDGFLLEEAGRRGARVIRERVEEIRAGPVRWVRTSGGTRVSDLIVLASGVNGGSLPVRGSAYEPPRTALMAQGEVFVGEAEVRRRLGSAIHVFFPRSLPIIFGTLAPKGDWVGVSLLGRGIAPAALRQFLALDAVRRVLPALDRTVCACRPRIAVGSARVLFGDGFVAVGDAGVTRLYKNGIGMAAVTARRAAETAILHGIGAAQFARHYAPLCRRIRRDNRLGSVLFRLARFFVRSRRFSSPSLVLAAREDGRPSTAQTQARVLWGLLTGNQAHAEIVRMLLAVRFQRRWLGCLVRAALPRPVPRV